MRRPDFVVDEGGTAIVEFAIIVPLLIGIAWGIVALGQLFYTLNSLSAAVREGARYAAIQPAPNDTTVKGRVTSSFIPLGGVPLSDTQVQVTRIGDQITVSATYPVTLLGTTMTDTLTQSAVYRWEMAP